MKSKDLYLRLLGYVRPHKGVFAVSILGTVVLAATEPALPALLKPLLDSSFVDKDPQSMRWMPALLVALFLIRGLASFTSAVAMRWVANRVVMDLREEMFQRLLSLPTGYYDEHSGGSLLSKLTYDVNQVMNASTQALVVLVRDTLAVLGLLGWMLYLNWRLSLIAFLIAPAIAVIVRIIGRRLRGLSRQLQSYMGDLTHVIDEVIQGHKVVRIYGGQDYEVRRFHRVNNRVRQFNMKVVVAAEASAPMVQLLAVVAVAVVIYIASLESAADQLTVGGFVSLFGAMAMMLSPIKRLTRLNEHLQKGLAAAESIFGLIDEPTEPAGGAPLPGPARGALRFAGVGFRYPSGETPVLRAIDLEVQPGETVALVGASGSGKSTLAALLPRLYEISEGRIYLDGHDIAEVRLSDLRANLAYVSQDIVLFNDTVAANIAYGAPGAADEARIRAAAENAHAMEFIQTLPQGLDTLIGERGMRLSGGQRQRLAIARALYRDAPVLILDEATSALDTRSEQLVQAALERLRRGRTVLVIAHRLSTIESADRIVVLQKGEIVEVGTHVELLARGGVYTGLYRIQAAGDQPLSPQTSPRAG